MLFKRARELVSDVYHGLIQGTVRDIAKCNKIIKAVDDNNIEALRTVLNQLNRRDVEDYLRRPVDSMKRTPLHFAAWAENCDILEVLLDYVNEPDIEDKTGATPMMFVVGSGNNCLKKMIMLINKQANVNRKDKSGWTLLHAAVQSKKRGKRVSTFSPSVLSAGFSLQISWNYFWHAEVMFTCLTVTIVRYYILLAIMVILD